MSAALFTAGCMDAFHTLAANRLISGTAPTENLVPLTWALCRLFNAAITMVGVALLLVRGKKDASLGFIVTVSVASDVSSSRRTQLAPYHLPTYSV